jgi:hypothetical protein
MCNLHSALFVQSCLWKLGEHVNKFSFGPFSFLFALELLDLCSLSKCGKETQILVVCFCEQWTLFSFFIFPCCCSTVYTSRSSLVHNCTCMKYHALYRCTHNRNVFELTGSFLSFILAFVYRFIFFHHEILFAVIALNLVSRVNSAVTTNLTKSTGCFL